MKYTKTDDGYTFSHDGEQGRAYYGVALTTGHCWHAELGPAIGMGPTRKSAVQSVINNYNDQKDPDPMYDIDIDTLSAYLNEADEALELIANELDGEPAQWATDAYARVQDIINYVENPDNAGLFAEAEA